MLSAIAILCFALRDGSFDRAAIFDRVDLIEVNHSFDADGVLRYDQVIFYDWSPDYSRFDVLAWSLIDDELPTKLAGGRGWEFRWLDRDAKRRRVVSSKFFRETWTIEDPERVQKRLLDDKYRRGLSSR